MQKLLHFALMPLDSTPKPRVAHLRDTMAWFLIRGGASRNHQGDVVVPVEQVQLDTKTHKSK
ncbi:hypothetical protein EYF80_031644 [Liparis tanakae]|uniref:Uncharacterized protein n=1 Tax=Liparis tanakae TaxID=230148 RepID=A0A4Z2GXT4_9TELE|nr:hypothetical protein EYF80_031644 [Liparis tanakae]